MIKFRIKDELGREVSFRMACVDTPECRAMVVRPPEGDYSGPSITNAAEAIWKALDYFIHPDFVLLEYYPEQESVDEVVIQKNDDNTIQVRWKPLSDEKRCFYIDAIENKLRESQF